MKMPTQLNRLFRLYVIRKKGSTENIGAPSHKDNEPPEKHPNHPLTRKSSKTSRRA